MTPPKGFLVMIMISSIFLLSLMAIMMAITVPEEIILNLRKRLFEGMALQKLYILYTNGHAVTATMNKNFEMKISQRFLLEYDHCSYFGFYEQPTIHIFAASNKNTSYITRNSKHLKFVGDQLPHNPFMFEVDTCQVRILNFFWIIGNMKLLLHAKRY